MSDYSSALLEAIYYLDIGCVVRFRVPPVVLSEGDLPVILLKYTGTGCEQ